MSTRVLFCDRCNQFAALHEDNLCDPCSEGARRARERDRAQDENAASLLAFNTLLGIEAA